MSDYARIGILKEDGTITATYCHAGMFNECGKTLIDHYTNSNKVAQLLKLGRNGISFIAPEIGTKNDFGNPNYDVCMFYGRDGGENNNMITKYTDIDHFAKESRPATYTYLYVPDTNSWRVFKRGKEQNVGYTGNKYDDLFGESKLRKYIRAEIRKLIKDK